MTTKKKLFMLLLLLGLMGLALPASNLILKPDNSGTLKGLAADASPTVGILEGKCVVCHCTGSDLPFYASFPIAGSIVEADIEQALRFLDWGEQKPDSEVALAKLERAIQAGSMPPIPKSLWSGSKRFLPSAWY